MSRLRALLRVAPPTATRNATTQQPLLRVAFPSQCNTQQPSVGEVSEARRERALAYLEEHPHVKRTCFADVSSDPANVILTVAVRDPWGVVEVAVSKDRFDALALMDLAAGYPDTALSVPEH